MTARLIESLATTGPLAEIFSDESVVGAVLQFEVALARAEAKQGLIPESAADAIAASAKSAKFDIVHLSHATLRAGTPSIPLVKMFTEHVRKTDEHAARFVHWGATSQDIADTAMSLSLQRAQPLLMDDLQRLETHLAHLSEEHSKSVMLGRTLLQAAPPITFGLKAAGWLSAIRRGRVALQDAYAAATMLQFGGATGTLASLGDQGTIIARELAKELALTCPEAPWHTQRDCWATLLCSCGVLTGSLGKMARDISLLMQNEVDEAAEPGVDGRGGSSTMPHKRNPIACSLTLAAAHRVPGLIASYLSAMVQEHERGIGGWQAEWPIIAAVIQSTGLAIASMVEAAEGLSVNVEKMRVNLDKTEGTIFAERAAMLLAEKLGRDVAHKILEQVTKKAIAEGRHLRDVLAEVPEVSAHLDRATLQRLEVPEDYLGSAESFRKALLSASARPDQETNQEQ
jgi:3-carboxy-cis,cis-muconate cycloisomerase